MTARIADVLLKGLKNRGKKFQNFPKYQMSELESHRIVFAEFELDTARRKLYRDGRSVTLYSKTFDLLEFLAEKSGTVITKNDILNRVWAGQFVEEANLSVQISALRKALGESKDAPRFIVTIPGTGYKFVADVHNPGDTPDQESRELAARDEEINKLAAGRIGESRSDQRYALFAAAGLGLLILFGLAAYRYFSDDQEKRIDSIAVLPFVSQNLNSGNEYLADGLAESVIYSLSGLPELRVMSRNSTFRYRGSEADAKSIGLELNVQAILTGRVVQQNDNLSVSAELVSANDNSVIWGEQFTRKMSDLERLQTEIAEAFSQKLRPKVINTGIYPADRPQLDNPETYRLYLLGRYHLNRLTDDDFRKAADYFQQVIARQPNYAPAYAGLAESHHRLSGYNAVSPHHGFPKAREAALKALELDPTLAEAHATLAAVKHLYDWDWPAAEAEFMRAIELNPNSSDTRQTYGFYLSTLGRFDEAIAEIRRAQELDPLSIEKIAGLGEVHYLRRNYDQAIEHYHKVLDMEPNSGFAHWATGRALLANGKYEEAIAAFRQSIPLSGDSPDERAELARAYARMGRQEDAVKIVDELKRMSESRYVAPVSIASIYGELGNPDLAFTWFDKAVADKDFLLVLLKVDPMFDNVRADARFAVILRRVGLPE